MDICLVLQHWFTILGCSACTGGKWGTFSPKPLGECSVVYFLKGVCQEIFDFDFFHGWNLPKCSIFVSISPRYSIIKLSLRCTLYRTLRRQNMFLVNQHVILQIFSFLIDVFTPKRIYPDCPFKCIQRQVKISILTPQCAVCLFGDFFKYTVELWVWCTSRR